MRATITCKDRYTVVPVRPSEAARPLAGCALPPYTLPCTCRIPSDSNTLRAVLARKAKAAVSSGDALARATACPVKQLPAAAAPSLERWKPQVEVQRRSRQAQARDGPGTGCVAVVPRPSWRRVITNRMMYYSFGHRLLLAILAKSLLYPDLQPPERSGWAVRPSSDADCEDR